MDYLQKIWKAIKEETGGRDLSGEELYRLPICWKKPFRRDYYPDMDNIHIQRVVLREAALDGFAPAALHLGGTFDWKNDGCLPPSKWGEYANLDAAIEWYTRAASGGNSAAMWRLSKIYEEKYDRKDEIEWAQKAADRGHPDALEKLTHFALNGVVRYEGGEPVLVDGKEVRDYPLTGGKDIPFPENHVAISLMERNRRFKDISEKYLHHADLARDRGDTEVAKEYATKGFQYLEVDLPVFDEHYRLYGELFELSMDGRGDRSDKGSLHYYKIVEKTYREGIGIPPDVRKADDVARVISGKFKSISPLSRGQELMARAAETVALHNCGNNIEVASQSKFSMER